jgi:hypothetical protein
MTHAGAARTHARAPCCTLLAAGRVSRPVLHPARLPASSLHPARRAARPAPPASNHTLPALARGLELWPLRWRLIRNS